MYLSGRKQDTEISKRKKKVICLTGSFFTGGGGALGPICPSRDRQGEG